MIPKIIHYCWLSGDPFPAEIQQCIDSWHKYLPDYEFRLWDTKRFDIESTAWTSQSFKAHKYAFAADYIRLYALYNYGGIYLDADVLVYKSFDELLSLPYFIGCDQIGAFEAAVIGAEEGCKWIGDILSHYNERQFFREDGSMDIQELPITFHHELVSKGYTFIKLHKIPDESTLLLTSHSSVLYVFDGNFFNSRNQVEVRKTKKSFCAHDYAGTWQEKKKNESWIKKRLPKWLLNILLIMGHKTWNKNKYSWFTIPFNKQL